MSNFPMVDLLSAPEHTLKTIYVACRTCYSALYPVKIWEESSDEEKMLNLVKKVLSSGHHSTVEHCQFVFAISGVSRACTHQLVRHRHMSFSQKSQRYVTEKGEFEYITPKTIEKSELKAEYEAKMKEISDFYAKMVEAGIPAEDARFVLPNACETKMVVTMNARSLYNFFAHRCCTRAQWEIREVANQMLDLVKEVAPIMFAYAGPPCVKGPCPEGKMSCGKMEEMRKRYGVR